MIENCIFAFVNSVKFTQRPAFKILTKAKLLTFFRRTYLRTHPLGVFLNMCAGQDSNLRRTCPTDLQSVPVDRLGTDAYRYLLVPDYVNTFSFFVEVFFTGLFLRVFLPSIVKSILSPFILTEIVPPAITPFLIISEAT